MDSSNNDCSICNDALLLKYCHNELTVLERTNLEKHFVNSPACLGKICGLMCGKC
jgi:hypothetical protein